MKPGIAHLLVRLYPRAWRARYGEEFEMLLTDGGGGFAVTANVARSALFEWVDPTTGCGVEMDRGVFSSWCERAPWAIFGVAPVLLLAGAYCVACLILWSGWRFLLPESNTPFVPVYGFSILYFGVGRLIYYCAPLLIGWIVACIAARQNAAASWLVASLAAMAWMGTSSQVHAIHLTGGVGGAIHMSMALASTAAGIVSELLRAAILFALMLLPYLILRMQKPRSVSS